jgi:predicted nucleic acid-binding protein
MTRVVPTPDPALIDTDVASVLYRAQLFQRVVSAGLARVVADRPLAISVVTLGEASYGALSRKWSARRTGEMLAFYADHFDVIELGRHVAVEYGRLRAASEALGRPVASNDLWIAASATANGLPLVTLNRRHFEPLTLHGLRLL